MRCDGFVHAWIINTLILDIMDRVTRAACIFLPVFFPPDLSLNFLTILDIISG
jgi:hypothetical protein